MKIQVLINNYILYCLVSINCLLTKGILDWTSLVLNQKSFTCLRVITALFTTLLIVMIDACVHTCTCRCMYNNYIQCVDDDNDALCFNT